MRVRRVRLQEEEGDSVAVWDEGRWVPLVPALARLGSKTGADLGGLTSLSRDVVTFCAEHETHRSEIARVLDFVREEHPDLAHADEPRSRLPFAPVSFRDFMLYEAHAIDAARGMVKRFMPGASRVVSAYESVFRRPPGVLRPKPIWYEKPIYYMGSHLSFVTHGDVIPWPAYTKALDYELELGVVIGRPLFNATPEQALRAIGGFVVVNDFSARDVQYPEMRSGFGPVKAKNFANAMSAEVVTADELLPRVTDLDVEVRINGKLCGRGSTAGMQHSLGDMVAYASLGERLVPGELLATGTIPGCSGMETGQWLAPGDEIELTMEGLGSLMNVIGTPPA